MTPNEGEEYLIKIIMKKISVTKNNFLPQANQKISALSEIYYSLINHSSLNKTDLLTKYPSAFKSFWSEKSDLEQLVDAANMFTEVKDAKMYQQEVYARF